MTEFVIALALVAVVGGIVGVDYLAYRREQDAKAEKNDNKEKLKDEIHRGHNLTRIQHLAGRVQD